MSKTDIVLALPKNPDSDGVLDLAHARRMYGPEIRQLTPALAKRIEGLPTWGIAHDTWGDTWNDGNSRLERASYIKRFTVQRVDGNGNVHVLFDKSALRMQLDKGVLGSGEEFTPAFVWLPAVQEAGAKAKSPEKGKGKGKGKGKAKVGPKARAEARAKSPERARAKVKVKAKSSKSPALIEALANMRKAQKVSDEFRAKLMQAVTDVLSKHPRW